MCALDISGRQLRWFIHPDEARAERALYCLPHSGGGATAYRDWLPALPTIAVRPLQPPGRESRLAEPPVLDPVEIADVVLADPRPFAFYGHSLGALLAYEVTRELRRRGGRLPERLFLGACRPPWSVGATAARFIALDDDEFVATLVGMGGSPPEVWADPTWRRILLRLLRADFGWMAGYEHRDETALPVPVVAFVGQDDPIARPDEVAGWARLTSVSFTLHAVPGGHFFGQTQVDRLTRAIEQEWAT
ncbi:thioesterase II family protein [Micromonospora sp. NPDC003197]